MPIRPKKPESLKGKPRETESPAPHRRRRIVSAGAVAPAPAASKPEPPEKDVKPRRRRGHARKDERGKWKPTGDYETGFCRPPLHGRFDGKRGPGRPKGSRSQDSYWKEELNSVRTVSENGAPKKYRQRELILKLIMKGALEHKRPKDLAAVDEIARRLFPDASASEANHSPLGNAAFDQVLLQQLFEGLQLGEARPGAAAGLADALFDQPSDDDVPGGDEQPWDDEDWSSSSASYDGEEIDED